MSLKSIAFKTALLSGLFMTGLVFEPANAMTENQQADEETQDDEMMHHECGEMPPYEILPEESDIENLLFEPLEEEAVEPENVELVIQMGGDIYTQVIYFAEDSAELSVPAQMIVDELAADLEMSENASISVIADASLVSGLQLSRIAHVADAFDKSGLPAAWVRFEQPYTLAAAY